ncbi:cob(I)yrinic acid a,c-diamide adenosyltransferase [Candidatus Micrarchaeota archaeon]|nr:cob(I)yrinic acid a,c-diamide adenosyltransferase [Candidatus Micrarchaeota archaeon]
MPIYTKFGDAGKTRLLGTAVVDKDDPKVQAYGSVDELNALLGIVIASNSEIPKINENLTKIQNDLFVIGAQLAAKDVKTKSIEPKQIEGLEHEIDKMEAELPRLTNFILPGGHIVAASLHHARTVCRRTERCIVTLAKSEKVNEDTMKYMNRLSDFLFVLARFVNYKKKHEEKIWRG